jgi:HEPN domain-containing protein
MADRSADWLKQADADLRYARHAQDAGHYEWAAFASHQAAEMAVKGLFKHLDLDAWGRAVSGLLVELPEPLEADVELLNRARELDKHFIMARYPDGYDSGAPVDYYTPAEAQRAVEHAEAILAFCRENAQQ